MERSKEEAVKAIVDVLLAVGGAIRDFGDDGVPSGHLYAVCCGHLSLETYNDIIAVLKQQKLVTESNYLLRWVGP